jgi:hypothetical protein
MGCPVFRARNWHRSDTNYDKNRQCHAMARDGTPTRGPNPVRLNQRGRYSTSVLEEIVERTAGRGLANGSGFTFDRRASLEQIARVERIFGGDPRGNVPHTLVPGGRIERLALGAAMQRHAALGTRCVRQDGGIDDGAAPVATYHVSEAHHFGRPRSFRTFTRAGWGLGPLSAGTPVLVAGAIVLVTALFVFPVTHRRHSLRDACNGQPDRLGAGQQRRGGRNPNRSGGRTARPRARKRVRERAQRSHETGTRTTWGAEGTQQKVLCGRILYHNRADRDRGSAAS